MMLRAEIGEVDDATAKFWTEVQNQDAEQRLQSFGIGESGTPRPKKRRPRRRRPQKTETS